MRSRRTTAADAPPDPDEGYQSLSVAEVLADLASLDTEQLLMVKSLEEAGARRGVILDRIGDLLVVQEAAHHVRSAGAPVRATEATGATGATGAARAAPPAPTLPPPPPGAKAVSPELLDQMSGLLAKDAARRSPALHAAPTQFAPPTGPPLPRPETSSGLIVPTDGRRSRVARGPKVLIGLVIVMLVGAGGAAFWKQTHQTKTPAAPTVAPLRRPPLPALLLKSVPGGLTVQADSVGDTGPSDLAKAVRDDGAPDAQSALTQAGFVQGYQQLWDSADKQQRLVVFLYQFRTAAGATAYGQRMVASSTDSMTPAPTAFAVSGIPGAIGLSGTDHGIHAAQTIFHRGSYLVGILTFGPDAASLPSFAQRVSAAQYALLAVR